MENRTEPAAGRTAIAMLVVGVGYLAGAAVGAVLSSPGVFATFWPPNGLLLGMLLRADRRLWPYLVLATFPANLAFCTYYDQPGLLGVAYWIANIGEAVGVAAFLRRRDTGFALATPDAVVRLTAASAIGAMVAATIGASATQLRTPGDFAGHWVTWWMSDLLSLIVVGAIVVSLPSRRDGRVHVSWECGAFAAVLALACAGVAVAPALHVEPRIVLQPLLVPVLGWAVLRLGVPGTSWALLVASLVIVFNHVQGRGAFVGPDGFTPARAAAVQAVLSGLSFTFLYLAVALRQTRDSAARLQSRDDSRQTFVAAMAHEIRNPLGVIFASVSRAREAMDAGPLQDIERAARAILEVVEEVLSVGRVEQGGPILRSESLWLPALWRELRWQCAGMPRVPDVALDWIEPTPDVTLVTDRRCVVTIVRNLVGNALKFTDRGSVRVACVVADDTVTFTVEDTGIGIPLGEQARVFELYQRGQGEAGRRPGTGLGLYLVKRYAEACGGGVTVSGRPGAGSTFTVTLPRTLPTSAAA